MHVAEHTRVAAVYPHVPASAVTHLLWALHRAVTGLHTDRRAVEAMAGFFADLLAYRGNVKDLDQLGADQILTAWRTGGRRAVLVACERLQLAAPPRPPSRVYVIVGDALAARCWAAQRRVGPPGAAVLAVRTGRDAWKLTAVPPALATIVQLDAGGVDQRLWAALTGLVDGGALVRPAGWRPGETLAAGEVCELAGAR